MELSDSASMKGKNPRTTGETNTRPHTLGSCLCQTGRFGALAPNLPVWQLLTIFLGILAEGLTGLVLCLFPNGRFVPRWLAWVALVFVVTAPFDVINNLLPSIVWMKIISGPGFLLLLALILGSQVYRYIRVSTPLQRQQTKWLLFGVSMVFLFSDLGFYVLPSIFPWLGQPGSFSSVFFGTVLWALLFNCIPTWSRPSSLRRSSNHYGVASRPSLTILLSQQV